MYLRVTVGTDQVEGIPRLVGKICFLEKNQQKNLKLIKDFSYAQQNHSFIIMTILIHKVEKMIVKKLTRPLN